MAHAGRVFTSGHSDSDPCTLIGWGDEGAWLTERAWKALRQCLKSGGKLRIDSTPTVSGTRSVIGSNDDILSLTGISASPIPHSPFCKWTHSRLKSKSLIEAPQRYQIPAMKNKQQLIKAIEKAVGERAAKNMKHQKIKKT